MLVGHFSNERFVLGHRHISCYYFCRFVFLNDNKASAFSELIADHDRRLLVEDDFFYHNLEFFLSCFVVTEIRSFSEFSGSLGFEFLKNVPPNNRKNVFIPEPMFTKSNTSGDI